MTAPHTVRRDKDVVKMSAFQTTPQELAQESGVRYATPRAARERLYTEPLRGARAADRPALADRPTALTDRPTLLADRPTLRIFDLSVCLLLLPLVLVVGAITALLIFIDSPGSVFYRSTRVGRDGHPFQMLKFRKMRRTARGGPLTIGEDERFTPIGSFLAMTKLDELPQLWNVIRGDMRLVGPRPEVPEFVARFQEEYSELLSVLPGITGPAAVEYASESHLLSLQQDPISFYEESIMPRKIEIDLHYIRTRTLRGDLKILAQTTLVPLVKVAKRMSGDPQVRRIEAGVLLGACTVLMLIFAIASSGGS
jgi:lipopolysaccharide/colanic/teichoic acid biosynthesis glycosyltransferase